MICDSVIKVLKRRKSVYLIRNGGSAADAQHIAAEFEGTFYHHRRAISVMALTTNTSTLTAISNDIGCGDVFVRLVQAHVRKGDALIAISTSGMSTNVVRAARAARKGGALVIGFTGIGGGLLKNHCHRILCVPADDTARIQECHGLAGHILAEVVEHAFLRRRV